MSTAMLVRQCEALAQRLYHQCRDTSNAYKKLTRDLRKLRNVLGDIDEALDDSQEPTTSDSKLVSGLSQSRNVLEKLDMALVTYRCMSQVDVDADAVAGIKSAIEEATHELATAHEKITRTGEISMSACSCVLVRKNSQGSKTSSSWSVVNKDDSIENQGLDAQKSLPEPANTTPPSEEKEVCKSRLLPSASSTSLGSNGKTPSWRSISLDPLSKPIADASKMILSSNSPIEAPALVDQADSIVGLENREREQITDGETFCKDESNLRKDSIVNVAQDDTAMKHQTISPKPYELLKGVISRSNSSSKDRQLVYPTDPNSNLSLHLEAEHENATAEGTRNQHLCAETPEKNTSTEYHVADPAPQLLPKPHPSPAVRRQQRYKLMCCSPDGTEFQKISRVAAPKPLSTCSESSEDLYSATPPKKDMSANLEDVGLVPDPLKLRMKLLSLDLKTRPSMNSSRSRYGDTFKIARRNSVSVLAELEGEPVHPRTRSSSCSSLPRYESVVNLPHPPRRTAVPPNRYRRAARHASAPLKGETLGRSSDRARAASEGAPGYRPEKTPAATTLPPTPSFIGRKPADEALLKRKDTKPRRRVQYAIRVSDRTWYERDKEDTQADMLDQERIRHIVHYWNNCMWDHAEQYLSAHLDEINTGTHTNKVRRTQHLLAVCASFRGDWDEAIRRFIKVLRKPIRRITNIDEGDCAAAYWLGDQYAMQNRRADALLAYSLAEKGSLFDDDSALRSIVAGEQIAVQLGVSKADFKSHWSEQAVANAQNSESPSILDKDIVRVEVAKICLESGLHARDNRTTGDFAQLVRARHLYAFTLRENNKQSVRPDLYEYMAMKIDDKCLDPGSPWPMPYDPLFCMPNVQRGRLLAYECDMLAVFKTNPEAKLPRPLSLTKFDCFTCNDLDWLILTIRTCLKTYEIDHSEVVNVQGTWFCCRYSFVQLKIATTHYFSIALFKHPFRSTYGVDICSDEGMCSARIVEKPGYYNKGVHFQEPKRIKQLIRKYLNEAEKRVQTQGKKAVASKSGSQRPSQKDIAWASSQFA